MSEEKAKDSVKQTKTDDLGVLSKAAETIAGDNKLLGTLLKIVLGPVGIIAALCGAGYLWWKNTTYKSRITELEKELQSNKFTIKELEKEIKTLEGNTQQKNSIVYKVEGNNDSDEEDLGYVPPRRIPIANKRNLNNRNIHLD